MLCVLRDQIVDTFLARLRPPRDPSLLFHRLGVESRSRLKHARRSGLFKQKTKQKIEERKARNK